MCFNAQCTPGGRDYVEVLGGFGLDTSSMSRFVAVCGLHAEPGTESFIYLIMAALRSRCGRYIFILWFLLSSSFFIA